MDAALQMTFSNALTGMKIVLFQIPLKLVLKTPTDMP